MRSTGALGVNKHNHLTVQNAETNQTNLTVIFPFVFARNREMIPNRIASNEIKSMILDVQLSLVSSQVSLLNCIYNLLAVSIEIWRFFEQR